MNNLFMLYFESTIEVLVSVQLNLDQTVVNTKSDKFANGLGYFLCLPFVVVLPAVILFVICKTPDELKRRRIRNKWELIYKDLNVNSKFKLFQALLYILRRFIMIYILLSSFFMEYVSIQILSLVYLNCAITFYITACKPYEVKRRNHLELFNEATILLMTESMIFYTDMLDPV